VERARHRRVERAVIEERRRRVRRDLEHHVAVVGAVAGDACVVGVPGARALNRLDVEGVPGGDSQRPLKVSSVA